MNEGYYNGIFRRERVLAKLLPLQRSANIYECVYN